MATLTSQTVGSTTFGANYEQIVNTQGLSGRLLVVDVLKGSGDMTEAELVSIIKALGNAGGSGNGTDTNGPDAFTVVGVSAFDGSDPAYLVLQGTGTVNTTPVTGFTLAVVATFGLAV